MVYPDILGIVSDCRIPYDLAHKVCLEKCYKIRHYLAPLFGPDFVNKCVPIDESDEKQMKSRPGRKPRSPTFSVKRPAEEEDTDPATNVGTLNHVHLAPLLPHFSHPISTWMLSVLFQRPKFLRCYRLLVS